MLDQASHAPTILHFACFLFLFTSLDNAQHCTWQFGHHLPLPKLIVECVHVFFPWHHIKQHAHEKGWFLIFLLLTKLNYSSKHLHLGAVPPAATAQALPKSTPNNTGKSHSTLCFLFLFFGTIGQHTPQISAAQVDCCTICCCFYCYFWCCACTAAILMLF